MASSIIENWGETMRLGENVYMKKCQIAYANAYKKKSAVNPSEAHRLFVVLDSGERVTLHAAPAQKAAQALKLNFSASF